MRASVSVRYDAGMIDIATAAPPMIKKTLGISLTDMKGRHRLAEAVMLAAMSSAAAPPLPDDKLLG